MSKPASDEAFREAWKQEIKIGLATGKLTRDWTGKADLKTSPLAVEDHQELKEKYGK